MNFTTEIAECLITPAGPVSTTPTVTDPCGSQTPVLVRINVSPDYGTVETHGTGLALKAYATYSNGTVTDATLDCVWSSNQSLVPVMGGLVKSDVQPLALAPQKIDASITASLGGKSATAQISGTSFCTGHPLDVVLVLAKNSSMGTPDEYGVTRLAQVKRAALNVIQNMQPNRDRVGLVAVTSGAWTGTAEVLQGLVDDAEVLLAEMERYELDDSSLGNNYSAPAAGLELARAMLEGKRALAKAIIILITDMGTTVWGPSPLDVVTAIEDAGIQLEIVGIDMDSVSDTELSLYPSQGYMDDENQSTKLYFPVAQPDEAIGVLSGRLHWGWVGMGDYACASQPTTERWVNALTITTPTATAGQHALSNGIDYGGFSSPVFSLETGTAAGGDAVPGALTINATTGLLTWNASFSTEADYQLDLRVEDAVDAVVAHIVFHVNDDVIIIIPPEITRTCSDKGFKKTFALPGGCPVAYSFPITRDLLTNNVIEPTFTVAPVDPTTAGDITGLAFDGRNLEWDTPVASANGYKIAITMTDIDGCISTISPLVLNVATACEGVEIVSFERICGTGIDKVGRWGQFGPDGEAKDYHWSLKIQSKTAVILRTLKIESVDGAGTSNQHQCWSTSDSTKYPALIVADGVSQNHDYALTNLNYTLTDGEEQTDGNFIYTLDIYGAAGWFHVGYGYGATGTDSYFKATVEVHNAAANVEMTYTAVNQCAQDNPNPPPVPGPVVKFTQCLPVSVSGTTILLSGSAVANWPMLRYTTETSRYSWAMTLNGQPIMTGSFNAGDGYITLPEGMGSLPVMIIPMYRRGGLNDPAPVIYDATLHGTWSFVPVGSIATFGINASVDALPGSMVIGNGDIYFQMNVCLTVYYT